MRKISKMEWDIIDARVKKFSATSFVKNDSICFLSIVLEQFFPYIEDQLLESITDGSDDRGVDAIHIIEADQQAEIYIFQSKYRNSINSCDRTINDSDIMKISIFINDLFEKSDYLAKCRNFRLVEAVKRIWGLFEAGKLCRYRVVFCSNGGGLSPSAQAIADGVCATYSSVSFEFYGFDDLINDLERGRKVPENGSLQVIGREILERSDGDVRGVIASIDAMSFIELIKSDDGKGVKRHIFDENLRIFLGAQGGFNPRIIDTASSDDSYLFWYLNNGITITCRNFAYNKGVVNPIIKLVDFQIVNGAQTSHSLMEASRLGKAALNQVVLMIRVYATDRADIAERVAVATNSQARIQSRDLKSNSQILKKFEIGFREFGYFFERKKNMFVDSDVELRIDALKLGQAILAYDLSEPDKAKSDSDTIFDFRFSQLFNDSRDIGELVRLFELLKIIERRREAYIAEFSESLETGRADQYLVYGQWFVLYACGLIHRRSAVPQLPTGAAAEALVEEAVRVVARACSQQKAVAHYQMFRSARTKDKIYGELFGRQLELFER